MKVLRSGIRQHGQTIGKAVLTLSLVLNCAAGARAAQSLKVDSGSSEITFALTDTLHAVKGNFGIASGEVSFDPQTGAMSGLLTVNATSGHSDSPARDHRMIDDELKAAVFPAITFTPQQFTGSFHAQGQSTLQVTGAFTLLGKTHTITVPMNVTADNGKLTATGTFPIPYVAWGLKDPSVLFLRVGKVVTIDLKIDGTLTEGT